MIFLLRVSGIFSSLILIIAGVQIASIEIDLGSGTKQQVQEEELFNHLGTALMGFGCFTGSLLFGVASLINKENNIVVIDSQNMMPDERFYR